MPRVALLALAGLALAALLAAPRPDAGGLAHGDMSSGSAVDPLDAAARELLAIYARWDAERHDALFTRPASKRDERLFTWFKDQLGECRTAAPMFRRTELNARYVYACERGELEVELHLDAATSKIGRLFIGARAKEPPADVRAAADDALALLAAWDRNTFDRRFTDSFEPDAFKRFLVDFRERWGTCRLADVDLGSERGALFNLACERGERLMSLSLSDDGRIRRFLLTRRFDRGGG